MPRPSNSPPLFWLLPEWFAISEHRNSAIWQAPADFVIPDSLNSVLSLIEEEFAGAWDTNPQHVFTVAEAVTRDTATTGAAWGLWCHQAGLDSNSVHFPPLVFLRAFAVVGAMCLAGGQGHLTYAYDWMMCALDDRPFAHLGTGDPLIVTRWADRLYLFLNSSHSAIRQSSHYVCLQWATIAYQTAYAFGGPHLALREALPLIIHAANEVLAIAPVAVNVVGPEVAAKIADERALAVEALVQVAFWADAYKDPPLTTSVVRKLDEALREGWLPLDAADRVEILLTCAPGVASGVDPKERAANLLDTDAQRGIVRSAESRLILLVNAGHVRDIIRGGLHQELIAAIEANVAYARARSRGGSLAFNLLQATRYSHIQAAVASLGKVGAVADAIELTARWFGISSWKHGPAIYLTPSDSNGVVFASEGCPHTSPQRDQLTALTRVTAASDYALGTSTTVRGALELGNPSVDERAFIEASGARDFESALRDFYALDWIRATASDDQLRGASLFMPHVFRHPVQALLLESFGFTCPLISSFEYPAPDRRVQRALVWTTGTTTGEIETKAVTSVLESAGVTVDALIERDLHVAEFFDLYSNPIYDLVWLVGHGQFDGARPDEASIRLSSDGRSVITLPALAEAAISTNRQVMNGPANRRLLVLNLCESGSAMQASVPPRIGLGPLLAGAHQAVIGHLWSVRPYPPAFFGVVLAWELGNGTDFFSAFTKALRALRYTRDEVLRHLRELNGAQSELASRIEAGQDDEFTARGVLTWGSPAFYE
jgi:hypothetical protein